MFPPEAKHEYPSLVHALDTATILIPVWIGLTPSNFNIMRQS